MLVSVTSPIRLCLTRSSLKLILSLKTKMPKFADCHCETILKYPKFALFAVNKKPIHVWRLMTRHSRGPIIVTTEITYNYTRVISLRSNFLNLCPTNMFWVHDLRAVWLFIVKVSHNTNPIIEIGSLSKNLWLASFLSTIVAQRIY